MLDILFVTDYVCPYCLVAKEALRQALEESGISAVIRTQPHELAVEPEPRVDTYHDESRKSRYQILIEPSRRLGLEMKFPPKVIPRPYTRLAFEGWHFARERGCGDQYSDLVYRAYFEAEQDIGDIQVLAALAGRCGLDQEEFAKALREGTYTLKEQEAAAYSRDVLKITGVPTIYINSEKIRLSAYTKEEMLEILEKYREN